MPPRKRAEKKVEPEQEAPAEVEEYAGPKWPLLKREYLSERTLSRKGVHTGQVVQDLRQRLGLEPAGVYDAEVRAAVVTFQQDTGREVTGVVTSEDWEALHSQPESYFEQ
jgi:peptidoglycan hydrolase-like protein with peptidoglycan-binding domain